MQPQPGQQPPPQLEAMQNALSMPSWEDIRKVLKSDMQREYRVDVETDSTVAQSLQQDMEGLREVISGLVEFWTGVGPAVTSGALSMEAVKSISMTIVRRARMGLEVEDALESGMKEPKPQDNGEAAKAEAEKAKVQAKAQADAAALQQKERMAQAESAHEERRLQMEASAKERELQMEAALEKQRMQFEAQAAERQAQLDAAFARFKAMLEADTKIQVAEIAAEASVKAAKEKPKPETVQ